jgi:hypothetical protein
MVFTLIEEFRDARKNWPFIDSIEKNHKLPPRLLYAVGWRETKLQNIMGDFTKRKGEAAAQFHGFGVWQRDSGAFGVDATYLKNVRKQAKEAADLLAQNFKTFSDWPAAVAAYNCGPGNVRKALDQGLSVDHFTANGDYSADVLATRDLLLKGRVPRQEPVADKTSPPARSFFKVGRTHPSFTLMGERFQVWLKKDIRHDGNGYQPGPRFSSFDKENVGLCQQLMGDDPDGWFGPSQWQRLMTQRPPKRAHVGSAPVAGLRMTQKFGVKDSRYAAKEHTGVDYGSSGDDTIRAVDDGTCVRSSLDSDGWGNYVIIQHQGDRFSWYCHMTFRAVGVGDKVKKGQKLGAMGQTGNARGKHLHYQESTGGTGYFDYKRPVFVDPV